MFSRWISVALTPGFGHFLKVLHVLVLDLVDLAVHQMFSVVLYMSCICLNDGRV